MSRAFVKEPDGDVPEQLPELPLSAHSNYVTPEGLIELRERLARAEQRAATAATESDAVGGEHVLALVERELRWLRSRLASAIVVDPTQQPPDKVAFGAGVALRDPQGRSLRYRIVGEDQADPERGLISWVSPLARALRDAHVGDVVIWRRPAGDLEVEVTGIDYSAEA